MSYWEPTADEILAICCGITVLIYEYINPNMDAERDMHENDHKIRYHTVKYCKWLIIFIGWYCAVRVIKGYARRVYNRFS